MLEHLVDSSLDLEIFSHHRVVLAPTNEIVDEINQFVTSKMHGDSVEYLSADNISRAYDFDNAQDEIYTLKFLNNINAFMKY